MSAEARYNVWCDGEGCIEWAGAATSVKAARLEVKRLGWGRVTVDGKKKDLCPACMGKLIEARLKKTT
jgi:hypothetical protein